MKWWDWLGTLSQGQAAFLGSLVGALVGLLALLLGALFNARQNRKRDDRLRAEERRSVATALRAELAGIKNTLIENSEKLSHAQEHPGGFLVPDLGRSIRIWPHMIPKLGLFEQAAIESVTDAYLAVEQHGERLILLGGRLVDPERAAPGYWRRQAERRPATDYNRLLISLSVDEAPHVVRLNSFVLGAIEGAITQLDASLRTKRWWWQRSS
jgi:hypothetical protein